MSLRGHRGEPKSGKVNVPVQKVLDLSIFSLTLKPAELTAVWSYTSREPGSVYRSVCPLRHIHITQRERRETAAASTGDRG